MTRTPFRRRNIQTAAKSFKVWPLRHTDAKGNPGPFWCFFDLFAGGRPWAYFETFSETPQLVIYPHPARFSDAEIREALARDFGNNPALTEADCERALLRWAHMECLVRLNSRFTEMLKTNRKYTGSRYYQNHMKDTKLRFVSEGHVRSLVMEGGRYLAQTENLWGNIKAELSLISEVSPETVGESTGITHSRQDRKEREEALLEHFAQTPTLSTPPSDPAFVLKEKLADLCRAVTDACHRVDQSTSEWLTHKLTGEPLKGGRRAKHLLDLLEEQDGRWAEAQKALDEFVALFREDEWLTAMNPSPLDTVPERKQTSAGLMMLNKLRMHTDAPNYSDIEDSVKLFIENSLT